MFFFNDTTTTDIYTSCHTLSLHDALPIWGQWSHGHDGKHADKHYKHHKHQRKHDGWHRGHGRSVVIWHGHRHWSPPRRHVKPVQRHRSEEHTSELQSLMRISYAVFCLKKKK